MKATGMRDRDGLKFEKHELEKLCETILIHMARAGFKTEAEVLSDTSIKIGMHMSSFRIDTDRLGHNARPYVGRGKSAKGYKRTNVPTWDQRVEFNHIINRCLDGIGASCRVISGAYTVRTKDGGAVRSWYEGGDLGTSGYSAHLAFDITPEAEMRDILGSDRLEAEHKAAQAPLKREKARARRDLLKRFKASPKVTVSGFWNYSTKPDKRNGKQVTHAAFAKLLSGLDQWQARRVREASIKATAKPILSLVKGA